MTLIAEDGFQVGDIYFLKNGNTTELIPRQAISYVSAKYQSKPALLIAGGLLIAFGLYGTYTGGADISPLGSIGPIILGVLLVVGFFSSRRVGIVVASSGGRLFVETRGKDRTALLGRIHADLSTHQDQSSLISAADPHVPEIEADRYYR